MNKTIETLNARVTYKTPALEQPAEEGKQILSGKPTKWMTPTGSMEYTAAFFKYFSQICTELTTNPDSRRAVIHGPDGACWTSTQYFIRNNRLHTYTTYRSLDKAHLQADLAIQAFFTSTLANHLEIQTGDVTFNIMNFHEYV